MTETSCHKTQLADTTYVPLMDEDQVTKIGFDRIYVYLNVIQPPNTHAEWWQVGDKSEWKSYGEVKKNGKVVDQSGEIVRMYPSTIANAYTQMLGTPGTN